MTFLLWLLTLLPLLLAGNAEPFVSSISAVSTALHHGDTAHFALAYPQEAARQSRNPQFHDNPQVQVDCYQADVRVLSTNTIVDPRTRDKIAGGWSALSYGVALAGPPANELPGWLSGGASCSATLYYFDVQEVGHVLAQTWFEVGP